VSGNVSTLSFGKQLRKGTHAEPNASRRRRHSIFVNIACLNEWLDPRGPEKPPARWRGRGENYLPLAVAALIDF